MQRAIWHSVILGVCALCATLSACVEQPTQSTGKPYQSVDPARYSDFSTVYDCPVTIDCDHRALIKIYTVDPDLSPGAQPVYATFTDADGQYTGVMQLPTAYIGQRLWAESQSLHATAVAQTDGVTFRARYDGSRAEAQLTNMYDQDKLVSICQNLYDLYLNRLPENKDNTAKLTETSNLAIHTTRDDTEIMCSFINSGGRYLSQLYYFYFPEEVDTREYMIDYVTRQAQEAGTTPDLTETGLRTAFMRLFTNDADNSAKGRRFLLTDGWGVYYTGRDEYVLPGSKKNGNKNVSTFGNDGSKFVVYGKDDTEHRNPLSGNGFLDAKLSYTTEEIADAKAANVIVPGDGDATRYQWKTWYYAGNGYINRNFNNHIGAHHHLKYYGVNYDQEPSYLFPAGMRIGFILKVLNTDKYNPTTDNKSSSIHILTTNNEMNKGGVVQCARNLTVMPSDKEKEITNVVYGFEDALLETNGCDRDYNDFIFLVTATPEISTAGMTRLPEQGSMMLEGTMLYEDLYPMPGDYDMNDVMVEYEMTVNFNDKNLVTGIDCKFWPTNYGADYDDDFYIELRDGNSQYIDPTMVIDAARLRSMSAANLADIRAGRAPSQCVERSFTFDPAKVKVNKDLVKITNLNPFIYVRNTCREVHLTNGRFCGVAEATQAGLTPDECKYFPLMISDKSILDGCYFPYAMNVPMRFSGHTFEGFTPVTEKVYIVLEYQRFLEWMRDNTKARDWYRYYTKWTGSALQ